MKTSTPTCPAARLLLTLGVALLLLLGTGAVVAHTTPAQSGLGLAPPHPTSLPDDSPGHSHLPRVVNTIALTRGPTLQSVTPDSVVVVWETDAPATSRVDYGPTAAYGLVVSDTLTTTHHALTLTHLSPHAVHHYQVFPDGSGDSTFRAAAAPTQTAFSFVAFGDTRTDHAAHQSIVDRIVTLGPDFVLHTGDMVADGRVAAQWDTFFSIEQALLREAPFFGALGNHEMNSALYFDAFHLPGNERWYSFDYGNVHFVALQIDGYAAHAPGSEQYAWLENDLTGTDRPWKIVFFHIPPYTAGAHGDDAIVGQVRAALVPLFEQTGVDLVFNGHDHDYERSVVNGVTYIVTGGGGAPLYGQENPHPYTVYFTSTYHCVSVTIGGRSLSGVGVRSDSVQFDPFTLYAPPLAAFTSSSPSWLGQATAFTNTTATSGTTGYRWTFGDGLTSTLQNPSHAYALPGSYTVTLAATNLAGQDVSTGTAVTYGPPMVDFTVYPTEGLPPLTVTFTATATTVPPGDPTLAYLWHFGDGQSNAQSSPSHAYTAPGTYTVTLTASNAVGSDTETKAACITVRAHDVYLPLARRGQ